MRAEVLICVCKLWRGIDDQHVENIVAASGACLSESIPICIGSTLLRCENITAAIQVKRHHILVIPDKDFWITCSTCNCMNRGTGDF
jgi:hypothetical protein